MKRGIIVGAGALGGLFAAILAENGAEMTLYDVNSEKIDLINRRGLLIRDQEGQERKISLTGVDDLEKAPQADLILVLVKAYHTKRAAREISRIYRPGMKIVTLQNGLGNLEALIRYLPAESVFAGITYQSATQLDWGYIYHTGTGLSIIAPSEKTYLPAAMDLARFFNNHGVSAGASSDFNAVSWKKLVVNSAINPLSAIYRVPNGMLPQNPDAVRDMAALVVEGVAVAQKVGVPLNYGEMWGTVLETCRATAENKSSMLADVEAGRPTEIEAINGSIIRIGEIYGIDTPTNTKMLRSITAIQRGKSSNSLG